MTVAKSKRKVAFLLLFALAATVALATAVGIPISARADSPSWVKGKNVQAEGGQLLLANSAPGEEAHPPFGGFTLEDTTATERYTFKYNSASGNVDKVGEEWATTADATAENVPVWTLRVHHSATKNGKFILPVFYKGGNGVWVMMAYGSRWASASNNIYDSQDNGATTNSGYRMYAEDVSRGSSDPSLVSWDQGTEWFAIKTNSTAGGTAYLFGHFWYSSSSSQNSETHAKGERELSLGDLAIKVIVDVTSQDPFVENGTISLNTGSGVGYTLESVTGQTDYSYKLKLNVHYKTEYEFQVKYGNTTTEYLLTGDRVNGYGIVDGDCERSSATAAVVNWRGAAVNYTIAVPAEVTTGSSIVSCKIWVPADTFGKFGVVEAKTKLLGEFKVLVELEDRDLTTYFRFTGATKINDGANTIKLAGLNLPDVERFDNLEQYIEDDNTGVFFDNILYKPATAPAGATVPEEGASLKAIVAATATWQIKFNVHILNDSMEIYMRDGDNRDVPFQQGDTIVLKQDLQLLERYGAALDQCRPFREGTKEYWQLKQDQEYTYTDGAWSIDQRSIASITMPDTLSVDFEGTADLAVTLVAGSKADPTITWTVADETVATVAVKTEGDTHTVVVSGLKLGADRAPNETTVTATTADGQTAVCTVTVVDPTAIASVERVGQRARTVTAGQNLTLEATVEGGSRADKTLTWTSADEAVATVNSSGVVTGIKAGTVEITAACGGKSTTFTVTVEAVDTPDPVNPGDDTPSADDPAPSKKGCGGSVAGTSAALGLGLLSLCVLVVARKKECR